MTPSVTIDVNKFDPIPKLTTADLHRRARYYLAKLKEARKGDRPESAKMYEKRMNECLDELNLRNNV